jgi:hypothetical protein
MSRRRGEVSSVDPVQQPGDRSAGALEVRIGRLGLELDGTAADERRARSIAERAVAVLAERLGERRPAGGWAAASIGRLRVRVGTLDLDAEGEEQAADTIASAVVEALVVRLGR